MLTSSLGPPVRDTSGLKVALDLKKQVGPLPMGVWLAAIGGSLGIAGVSKMRQKNTAKNTPRVVRNEDVPYPYTAPLGSPVQPGPFGLAPAPGGPPAAQPIETNVDWQRAATTILIGRGFGAYQTQQALSKYLQGTHQLTHEESQIVEAALKWVGLPPDPPADVAPPLPPTVPPPTTTTGPRITPGPISMYWHGGAVYLTNGSYRTTFGLLPRQVDDLRRNGVPILGGPGSRNNQFHDTTPSALYEQIMGVGNVPVSSQNR